MNITTLAGGRAIVADGSLYAANTFLTVGLILAGLTISSSGAAIDAKYISTGIRLDSVLCNAGAISIVSCGNGFRWTRSYFSASSILLAYDPTAPDPLRPPLQTRLELFVNTFIGGTITLTGTPRLAVDDSSVTGPLLGAGLTVGGGFVPQITHNGGVAGSGAIDFASAGAELPDTATALTVDFRRAIFQSGVASAAFKVGGAAANQQTVQMDGALARTGFAVTAGEGINITARGAAFPNAVFTTPGVAGSIVPPSPLRLAPVAAADPTVFAFGFRVPVADYVVSAMSDNVASLPTGFVTRTTTGFSVDLAAAGGGNITPSVVFN
jgi:hypothetical protein